MVITRISPLPAARVAGLISAAIGVAQAILGAIASLVGLSVAGLTGSPFGPGPALLTGAGIAVIVFLAVSYGILGFVSTLVGATVYNRVALTVGGIHVEVSE